MFVGIFQVVDDLLPPFVVGIGLVAQIVVFFGREHLVVGKGYLLIESLQEEVTVSSQEFHLADAGIALGIFLCAHVVEHLKCRVRAGNGVVEALPHVGDVPVGGHDSLLDLKGVEHVAIFRTVASLVGIVAAYVEVPHREGGVYVFG